MEYLPLFFDIKQKHCLVVGGGDTAARKTRALLQSHALVTLIAPAISELMRELISEPDYQSQMVWRQKAFEATDIVPSVLMVVATNDKALNHTLLQFGRQQHIPVNMATDPSSGDFIFPSVLDRSPVVIAVASGGHSPILARQIRARLETLIPHSYSHLAQLVGNYRDAVKAKFSSIKQRRRFWENVLQGPIANHILAGRNQLGEQELQALLEQTDQHALQQGEVYLVGAGPGDPDLLTFKALRLMQQADVVFYDRLVSPEILALVRKEAEMIYVGKQRAWHSKRQEEINQLLLEHAQAGKRVLRLKGGDPFIFGRGGEEIATLAEQKIPFQVVPGITAASGCSCYAGIPLTHRDHAQSCVFVTGQLKEGELDLNWQALVQPKQTVVVYMGLAGLPELTSQLQKHGMAASMPAALVQQGTTDNQRVWISTIADLPRVVEEEKPLAPTLLIIGEVVQLHNDLAWF